MEAALAALGSIEHAAISPTIMAMGNEDALAGLSVNTLGIYVSPGWVEGG
jgi:hypothetical protein